MELLTPRVLLAFFLAVAFACGLFYFGVMLWFRHVERKFDAAYKQLDPKDAPWTTH